MSENRSVTIERLNKGSIPEATDVIASALRDEPGFASVMPNRSRRATMMHTLLGALLRDAFRLGHVWIAGVDQRVVGTAIWYAPGDHPIPAMRGVRMLPRVVPLLGFGLGTMRGLAKMGSNQLAHFPEQPCWYLAALGVAPDAQGKGVGSQLMQRVLREIDHLHQPAYLETGEEINLRFYRRLGFEIRESNVQLAPPPGPTCWTMWRNPAEHVRETMT